MAVRLSPLRSTPLSTPKRFLVLFSVRGWVNPMAIVLLEVTSSRIELRPSGLQQSPQPTTHRMPSDKISTNTSRPTRVFDKSCDIRNKQEGANAPESFTLYLHFQTYGRLNCSDYREYRTILGYFKNIFQNMPGGWKKMRKKSLRISGTTGK
jgi:hypothetical protein